MIRCPKCRRANASKSRECFACHASLGGSARSKRVAQLRGLAGKCRCRHNKLLWWSCPSCGRSAKQGDKRYRSYYVSKFQRTYIADGLSRSEAWDSAINLLAALDLMEARRKGVRSPSHGTA